mgnify:CR=1 FL=1|tara:strand:- start:84 stop:944 length:861 start_codon:yes stop_codon:yes gene_type:complete
MKQAVLSLSGGMDSSTVLLHLLVKGYKVTALSFDYGQKHNVELERAQQLVNYLNSNCESINGMIVTQKYHPVTYQKITLEGLKELLDSNLVQGGKDVPEGHYEEENMKDTVVPNRNKIFSSMIQAVALSIANKNKCDVHIAMGIHAGDHAIYPDCRQEFRNADYKAFTEGNWNSDTVTYYTPYLKGDKYDILKDGEVCCKKLDLSFDEVYKRTNTSYKPDSKGRSDYKSASSVERIEAFLKLGRKDPVEYINGWEVAKSHVEKTLLAYSDGKINNDHFNEMNDNVE